MGIFTQPVDQISSTSAIPELGTKNATSPSPAYLACWETRKCQRSKSLPILFLFVCTSPILVCIGCSSVIAELIRTAASSSDE